jgi:hypothetical protein
MRRELDYITEDGAALRWAFGCVLASYKARLAARPRCGAREALRHALACGALMLVIGFALLENAESQTEPPRSAPDQTTCDAFDPAHDAGLTAPPGPASVPRDMGRDMGRPARTPEPPCPARTPPGGIIIPQYRTP